MFRLKPDPICPDHPEISPIVLPSGYQNKAARLSCPECDRWLKWLPKADPRLNNLVFLPKPKEEVGQLQLFKD